MATPSKIARLIAFVLILGACENKDVPIQTVPATSIDYLIFGHVDGFCIQCDVLYKLQNGSLFMTLPHQPSLDPATAQFVPYAGPSTYDSAKVLLSEIPQRLLGEKPAIGTYFPDAGHYYIEIGRNDDVQHWYIEQGGTPNYLMAFLYDVSHALSILR